VDLETRIRADHPLRVIREIVNATLKSMSAAFDALYSPVGRESLPPERLLRALLLQAFYSIRSERQLVERIAFDLLFRWFVGLGVDDPVWDATTFTKNRDRLLERDIAHRFLAAVLVQAQVKALLSGEHSSVDGTLLDAWASTKSFRAKDGSGPPERVVEILEQPPDRTGAGQPLPELPDRVLVRRRLAEIEAEKALPAQAVADQKLHPRIADGDLCRQDQDLEHGNRIVG